MATGRHDVRVAAYFRGVTDWTPAVISAARGLLGAVVGGGATYVTQRTDRTDRGRGELRAALVGFGYVLDALHLQIGRLPRTTRVAVLSERLVNPLSLDPPGSSGGSVRL